MKALSKSRAVGLSLLAAALTPQTTGHAQKTADAPPALPAPPRTTPKDSNTIVEPFSVRDEAEFFRLLDLRKPELAPVQAAVQTQNWEAAKVAWAAYLETRKTPHWYWSPDDRAAITKLLSEKKQPLSSSVTGANNVLLRKFNFVGVPKTLDKAPQWNQGPNDWTSVLNRFGYFKTLGQAYWATGDEKYAQDFVFLTKDWIAKNPVPADVSTFGVFGNPWRALEDGLRVQGWLEAMQFFLHSPSFDAEAKYQMTRSLVEHARYMRAVSVRRGYRAGNWQVMEATGLVQIGIMLPEFTESEGWRQQAFDRLTEHMEKDVYPDGAHHELTPGYHMTVADQFLQVSLLCQKNTVPMPKSLLSRHEKMYEFLMNLSRPNRLDPPIADAGNHNIERLMADGALLYHRTDMRYFSAPEGPAGWIWTFGPDAFDKYAKLPAKKPAYTSLLMPDAQYVMLRTGWEPADTYFLFDMAPWGGGHSHHDQLQILAYAGNRDLLMDSGQYGYDQPLANTYFRTSAAHSVLMLDNAEQGNGNPRVLAWQTTPAADFVSGELENKNITHRRSILFMKPDYFVVMDHVEQSGPPETAPAPLHEITRLFHFAPGSLARGENNAAQTYFPTGMNIKVQTSGDGASSDATSLEMRKGWVAVAPAKADGAPVAAFITKSRLPATLFAVLTPFADAKNVPQVTTLPSENPHIVRLRLVFPDGRQDEIAIAAEPTRLQIGTTTGQGRVLFVRRGSGSQAAQSGVLGTAAKTPEKQVH